MINDSQTFRAAMAQLGSAVCVLSTGGSGGRYGITASAVTAVSDDPPSLIVCVNRSSGANAVLKTNGRVCVNVLSCDQEDISAAFSTSDISVGDRFRTGEWKDGKGGSPVLANTAAYFDCEIDKAVEYGTHTVFFCRAIDISASSTATCLIYQGRGYHKIEGAG